ncbi:carnitine dehydratase [Salipiger aestuarii]|uniref:CoA:oxalate CoA-transferase n=1 Tax=Salipiger aestuarii TaxID=568098 RepID=A0A327YD27_9RHOB|nr:CaiB/BaiF CoA-transferase family protein [Salipiger aestuarii]EIE51954.1 L-carnitine dehydratase/bile acid-inducible protein F [Citreicella sp. 357]KAA8609508.1 carnitine dehydratase [Salipiger aestuarii]KAA8610987.1 carnitine dehydratase [Salipiger aestuarii]KAB2542433.1 carnitine dehydratase [Salipiger aestuarii]RAK18764.1 CoA:oxalate CoA-transferase [Salipiger aestuarii]
MSLPLSGVTIVDFTRILSGPFATMILADLGATVIKIERPGSGDGARTLPPLKDGKSGYFAAVNRGKRSLALDFDIDTDRALLDRIIARADVLVENFRPGVMDRRNLGWELLHARHPELVYASVTGFGQTGPDAKRAAYDVIVQARSGLMDRTGTQEVPRRAGSSFGDLSGGMFLAQGILAALYDRARTGLGRRVDVSMLDAQLALMEQAVPRAAMGATPPPHPSRHPAIAPCEAIQASDGSFVLAAGTEAQFERLCLVLDLPIAGDARFADNAARLANARLLKRLIEAVTLDHTRSHWLPRMTAAGVPCAPIQAMDQVMKDPQLGARNMIVDVLDRYGRASFKAAGNPIKMSGMEDPPARPAAPELDGNRADILRWLEKG